MELVTETLWSAGGTEVRALWLIGLVALGLISGLLSGLFGVGGGFLLTPMLNVFMGVPYNLAVGSVLAQMALMTWVSARHHVRHRHVDFRLGAGLIIGSFLGAEVGVRLQGALRGIGGFTLGGRLVSGFDLTMAVIFVVLLLSIGIGMVREATRAARGGGEPGTSAWTRRLAGIKARPMMRLSTADRRISLWTLVGLGFLVSVLTGLLGSGGGVVNLPLMIYVLAIPTAIAIGTASIQTTVASIYSGIRHLMVGNVLWPLVIALLAGSLVGVRTGASLSGRIPRDRLRLTFGYIVLATALIVIVDIARKLV